MVVSWGQCPIGNRAWFHLICGKENSKHVSFDYRNPHTHLNTPTTHTYRLFFCLICFSKNYFINLNCVFILPVFKQETWSQKSLLYKRNSYFYNIVEAHWTFMIFRLNHFSLQHLTSVKVINWAPCLHIFYVNLFYQKLVYC